jgi:glycosyltransferase involved in cell wall biosynthesis
MSRSLAVGIIAPPWLPVPPPAYGGTETVLDALARGLQSAGHEVLLFTTGDATCPVPRAWCYSSALGVGVGGAADECRQVVDSYEALRGVDVIHDHTLVGPLYAHGIPDRPVVTTNHGPFNDVLSPVYRAVADRITVIAISHHQASTAEDGVVAAVIHHGLELDRVPVGKGDGGYVLFLGRMHPDKGVDVAIAAARAAGLPLRIAAKMSEPHERLYFDAQVAPLLGEGVEFVGEVGGAEKFELIGAATCLLNPIRWDEPFGMVMIEALACGTPVVSSDSGAASEIVDNGETGFVCRSEAIEEFASALCRVPTLDRARCRAVAKVRFSADRMTAEHVAVYRAAIGASGSSSSFGPTGEVAQGETSGRSVSIDAPTPTARTPSAA